MNVDAIAEHCKVYHCYGIDVPVSLDALSRIVKWRDRIVTQWPNEASLFKQVIVKSTATAGLAVILALSIAELAIREMVFLLSLPLQPFEKLRTPSVRIQESALTTLSVTLFSIEALWHNLVEKQVGQKMITPRLNNFYLDFYAR